MRVPALIATILLVAFLVAGCGGPEDPNAALSAACERQLEEIEELADEGGTAVAKSTEERLDETTLRECAGQDLQLQAAEASDDAESEIAEQADDEDLVGESEGTGGADAEGEADSGNDVGAAQELDPVARDLFSSTCGGCHTLSDAGTTGSVGPNLDDTELDAAGVLEVIQDGRGAMPAGLLDGEEAQSVADYVAAAAAAE